jgi:hypothetical protein
MKQKGGWIIVVVAGLLFIVIADLIATPTNITYGAVVANGTLTPTVWVYLPYISREEPPTPTPTPTPIPIVSSFSEIGLAPPSPAELRYRDPVVVTFHYSTTYSGTFRMWAVPYAGGNRHAYTDSPLYTGPTAGYTSRSVTVFAGTGEVVIDEVRIEMRTEGGETLTESSVPVHYTYRP